MRMAALTLMALLLLAAPLHAQEAAMEETPTTPAAEAAQDARLERTAVTRHQIEAGGRTLAYTATAGELEVAANTDDKGPKGRFFYTAFVLDGAEPGTRPLTFAFNGGPGAGSVWLNLGGLGPRRVIMNDDGTTPPPPYGLTDNEATWLAFTDLVFVDPVGTGLARPADENGDKPEDGGKADSKDKPSPFWDYKKDIGSFGEFIRLYLTRNSRWGSPLFLCGESYGTLRAAALAGHLHSTYGISLNGVVLVSPVLSMATLLAAPSNDLPYALFLPSLTAVAAYHGRLDMDGADAVARARELALGDYWLALAQGDALPEAKQRAMAERLAALTGLSPELLRTLRLRLDPDRFRGELLADKGLTVGRMDGSISGVNPHPGEPSATTDPSLSGIFGPFSAAMHAYLKDELDYESDGFYEFLNVEVNRAWNWSSGVTGSQGYVDTGYELMRAMSAQPDMRVWFVTGLYDLATPFFAADYTIDHLGLHPSLRGNVESTDYAGGHMMYTHAAERRKLGTDAKAFYDRTLQEDTP